MADGGLTRRRALALLGGAGVVGAGAVFGPGLLESGEDAPTTGTDDGLARDLAVRFAPTLYFDARERWFPTDPRPYTSERDGETVVDGFDAFDGYTRRFAEGDGPPAPTVFHRVRRYEDSPLAAVQFWLYSAFDQFTTNFHWHDWEVIHAFVDADEPQLFVASSHSRRVPNNEFLDPDPGVRPRVLSELGSHSSALSVNDSPDRFQRFPAGDAIADITNSALEVPDAGDLPAAYGLPRDEGFRLPYVVPELDGAPLYEHERLPAVERSSLVPPELTVHSFDALSSPPADLPARDTGLVLGHAAEGDADSTYDLVSMAEIDDIEAFTGPQLSFEFAVPAFGEDLIADHITTTGTPWSQSRYDNPAADISDPVHRRALADRYDAIGEPAPVNRLVAAVRQPFESDEAPDGEGLTVGEPTVEAVCLVESDPTAVPTFAGRVVVDGLPPGDHRLTVNGAGLAPHSERVAVTADSTPDLAGVGGAVALPAAGDAVKLQVDPGDGGDSGADLTDLAVEDDFAGRLYDAPLDGPDAVYVHRGGAYTTEVRDADDEVGAVRVNPAGREPVTVDRPRTGKASLASFLATLSAETREEVRAAADLETATPETTEAPGTSDSLGAGKGRGADGDREPTAGTDRGGRPETPGLRGLLQSLDAVVAAAGRAVEQAEAGNGQGADERLRAVADRLDRTARRLDESRRDLPEPVANAVDRRLDQAGRRVEQALAADKL
ncbi:hypothetical protein BRC83_01125 [Halobacteriales archaeon QS_1_68_17]|nr:MAG: hypothetical protein BRC83_01125 [Halobacteriales archaeon QS_1_68_17]